MKPFAVAFFEKGTESRLFNKSATNDPHKSSFELNDNPDVDKLKIFLREAIKAKTTNTKITRLKIALNAARQPQVMIDQV